MANVNRILIVGGGIAGLSLAIALRQQGYAPEIIERESTWRVGGTAIVTMANGVRVLRQLGVREDIHKTAAVIRRWGFFDYHGEPLCETDLDLLWKDVGPCLGISRLRLIEALLKGIATVPCRLGVSLKALTQDSNLVRVNFSDGTSKDYDLVVGADGIYSTVRRLGLNSSPPRYAGNMGWRSIAPIRFSEVTDNIRFLLGEGCIFGLIPIGDGYTYGFGGVHETHFEDPVQGRLERIRQRFSSFGGPVRAYLDALQTDEQLHFTPIEWVEITEWYKGRVVLVGDAAHAGPPHMAEGGCMALEDSLVLAEVLRTEDTVEHALEAYARRRMPRARWVQEQSRTAEKAWFLPPALRNATLRERGDQIFRDRYQPLIPMP